MDHLMLASTAIDVAAVLLLGFLVLRSGRVRDDALADQRATLETLRGDLAHLISEAEERTQVLDDALASRERRLRGLLAEMGRYETGRPAPRERDERESERVGERTAARAGSRLDPAEARLLRDLDVRIPHGRTA
jgi:hypothetical protein